MYSIATKKRSPFSISQKDIHWVGMNSYTQEGLRSSLIDYILTGTWTDEERQQVISMELKQLLAVIEHDIVEHSHYLESC